MTLLECNNLILKQDKNMFSIPYEITADDIQDFQDILDINQVISYVFNSTDSSKDFFKSYPDIKSVLGKKADDVFYARKLGYCLKGIPSKLVYALTKALSEQEGKYPNLLVWKCIHEIKPYAGLLFEADDEQYSVKDVIDNIFGKSVNLISDVQYKAVNDDCTELYISNTDRIALLPNSLAEALSEDNCRDIKYDSKLGLVLNDTPIRRFNGLLGITFDDYDLRGVI